ncbi:MAG: hydrolase TatD, partial [Opitutales bacterium]
IDHNNEETVQEVLDRGYWAAFSIYPSTKMGTARMVEIVRRYGAGRIIVDSACDWGISEPLGVAKTARLALERGIPAEDVRLICYQNALAAYGQSGQMRADDWLEPPAIDQRTVYEGNSILRGGREPKIEPREARRSLDDLIVE